MKNYAILTHAATSKCTPSLMSPAPPSDHCTAEITEGAISDSIFLISEANSSTIIQLHCQCRCTDKQHCFKDTRHFKSRMVKQLGWGGGGGIMLSTTVSLSFSNVLKQCCSFMNLQIFLQIKAWINIFGSLIVNNGISGLSLSPGYKLC
jgi:hypothetical protein